VWGLLTERYYGRTSYERLLSKARVPLNLIAATIAGAPRYAGRMLAAAILHHELFRPKKITLDDGRKVIRHTILVRHNRRLFKHVGPRPSHTFGDGLKRITRLLAWFGEKYPKRWNQASSSYLDIRGGKATNGFDVSYAQAARRIGDEAFDNLSTARGWRWWCPAIFFEKPVLGFAVLWLAAGLSVHKRHDPLSVIAFLVVFNNPATREKPQRRYIPSNVYWERKPDGHKVSKRVGLGDLKENLPRLTRYLRECFRQVAARCGRPSRVLTRPVPLTDRDRMILKHWRLIVSMTNESAVPKSERADAMHACVECLLKTYDENWEAERGAFTSYAAQAIEWALQDLMKALRRQRPVDRSINLNDPADNSADEDEDDKPQQPEVPDMMTINSLETKAAEAKLKLVAERLGCLDPRERQIIEGRLGLNGYKAPVTHRVLAAEFGLTAPRIKQIEDEAAAKLRAVLEAI